MAQSTPDARGHLAQARSRSHVVVDPHEEAALLRHLEEGEQVERLTRCQYASAPGLLVLTDRRVLLVVDTRFRRHVDGFALADLTSVQWTAGRVHGTVHLFTGGHEVSVEGVDLRDGRDLVETARTRLPGPAGG